jgi:MFS transporter, FSR family, fosmidomycin resistance protein
VLLTVFYAVSCAVQAVSGFWVDKWGPRPVLLLGLGMLSLSAFGYAASRGYAEMLACAALAGAGNGVFHPVDYSLINRKVSNTRLGHAYSAHGISGNLGWAAAPALMVSMTLAFSWRHAMALAGALLLALWCLVLWKKRYFELPTLSVSTPRAEASSSFEFLRIPAVWVCFGFFLVFAMVLSGVQAFAPEAARQLHAMPANLVAICVTTYMVCAAIAMVWGGFLAVNPQRCERIIAAGLGMAACVALTIGFMPVPAALVPALFGLMGAFTGVASPSRDMLVKRSTPAHASGRVYGVVYSGLDIGQAIAPLMFGALLDLHRPQTIWLGIACLQGALVISAFRVRHARREVHTSPASHSSTP